MTIDALDNGGDDSFPHVPRTPDGWLDVERMPVGLTTQGGVTIDLTPSVRLTTGQVVPITAVVPVRPS